MAGQNLYLSLDIRLQRAAEAALAGRRGAIVAIAPDSGEILALVSEPAYDANLFIGGISAENYQSLSRIRVGRCSTAAFSASTRPARPSSPFWVSRIWPAGNRWGLAGSIAPGS